MGNGGVLVSTALSDNTHGTHHGRSQRKSGPKTPWFLFFSTSAAQQVDAYLRVNAFFASHFPLKPYLQVNWKPGNRRIYGRTLRAETELTSTGYSYPAEGSLENY